MKKNGVSIIIMFAISVLMPVCAKKLVVVDSNDLTPLHKATIFSNSGAVLGFTDEEGKINIRNEFVFPISVSYAGYESTVISRDTDIVKLERKTKQLDELIVNSEDKDIVRLMCYVREYTSGISGKDTVIIFAEYIDDFFVPLNKCKKFKNNGKMRILNSRIYHFKNFKKGGDSVYCFKGYPSLYDLDVISHPYLVKFPTGKRKLTNIVISGESVDSLQGKYHVKEVIKREGDFYSLSLDCLSDEKNHTKSLWQSKTLGCSEEFNEYHHQWIISPDADGYYDASDVKFATTSIKSLIKGKVLKHIMGVQFDVMATCYYETYTMDVEYLSEKEAYEKYFECIEAPDIVVSPDAPALMPSIKKIIERCEQQN